MARALPSELRVDARHLRLVQPLAPLGRTHEHTDTLALVAKSVAMEREATSELWWRVSPRVLARLALCSGRVPDASAAGAVFGRILDEAPDYDPTREPLTGWLDAVVDRFARERLSDMLLTLPAARDRHAGIATSAALPDAAAWTGHRAPAPVSGQDRRTLAVTSHPVA